MVKEGTSEVEVAGDQEHRCLYFYHPLHQKGHVPKSLVALIDRIPFRLVGADHLVTVDQHVFPFVFAQQALTILFVCFQFGIENGHRRVPPPSSIGGGPGAVNSNECLISSSQSPSRATSDGKAPAFRPRRSKPLVP